VDFRGALLLALVTATACARAPHPRHQHLIDDQLVVSPAPSPSDYAAYTRVRLAMETEGGDLERAHKDLNVLLLRRPSDPHLWTTMAELEHGRGDEEAATAALERALVLKPDYGPALALRDSWTQPAEM
jgi:Tfp pilus assembly protein PilF